MVTKGVFLEQSIATLPQSSSKRVNVINLIPPHLASRQWSFGPQPLSNGHQFVHSMRWMAVSIPTALRP